MSPSDIQQQARRGACDQFVGLLKEATAAIDRPFFQLPVSEGRPAYRERVYCYELYHQLRSRWSAMGDYVLNGEVDKRAHPLLARRKLGKIPDLLVHHPGDMEHNLIVMEVKVLTHTNRTNVKKDLDNLAKFTHPKGGRYDAGIYLVFGGHGLAGLRGMVRQAGVPLGRLRLFWHQGFGGQASEAEWSGPCGASGC